MVGHGYRGIGDGCGGHQLVRSAFDPSAKVFRRRTLYDIGRNPALRISAWCDGGE
jgi:hypothetical protein